MKALTVLAILMMIGLSGCATNLINPLCLPDRPELLPLTVQQKVEMDPDALEVVALNDRALKGYIITIERVVEAHNEQFEATCY